MNGSRGAQPGGIERRERDGAYTYFRDFSRGGAPSGRHAARRRAALGRVRGLSSPRRLRAREQRGPARRPEPPDQLKLVRCSGAVHVRVENVGSTHEVTRQPGGHSEGGRGLQIVATLSETWSVAHDGIATTATARIPARGAQN